MRQASRHPGREACLRQNRQADRNRHSEPGWSERGKRQVRPVWEERVVPPFASRTWRYALALSCRSWIPVTHCSTVVCWKYRDLPAKTLEFAPNIARPRRVTELTSRCLGVECLLPLSPPAFRGRTEWTSQSASSATRFQRMSLKPDARGGILCFLSHLPVVPRPETV